MSVKILNRGSRGIAVLALLVQLFIPILSPTVFAEELPGTQPIEPTLKKRVKTQPDRLLKPPLEQTYYERVQNLMDTLTFSKEELLAISPSVNKIALYRNSDKENKQFPSKIYNLVENGITRKLLDTHRFQLFECMECKSTQLIMKEDTFVILRAIESNKRLSEVAKEINVDGFFLWNIYSEKGRMFLNFKIVRASNGEVVWTRKFDEIFIEPELLEIEKELRPYETVLTTGIWGYKMSRTATSGALTTMDRVATFGVKVMREAKDSQHLIYGIGVDYFANVVKKDYFNLTGFTLYGHLNLKLDKILSTGEGYSEETERMARRAPREYFSTLNYYLSIGEAFFMDNHTELYKSGLDIRFSERFSFGVGIVYIPEKNVEMAAKTGFDPNVAFGGFTYDIMLGFVF
jgi:hypothetical protein